MWRTVPCNLCSSVFCCYVSIGFFAPVLCPLFGIYPVLFFLCLIEKKPFWPELMFFLTRKRITLTCQVEEFGWHYSSLRALWCLGGVLPCLSSCVVNFASVLWWFGWVLTCCNSAGWSRHWEMQPVKVSLCSLRWVRLSWSPDDCTLWPLQRYGRGCICAESAVCCWSRCSSSSPSPSYLLRDPNLFFLCVQESSIPVHRPGCCFVSIVGVNLFNVWQV